MEHTVCHFEFPSDDLEKARAFYTKLFGWKTAVMPGNPDYALLDTGAVVGGGIQRRQMKGQTPIFYIGVEDAARYIEKAVSLGGRVIVPRQEVPGFGFMGVIADPEGNVFGIFQGVSRPEIQFR